MPQITESATPSSSLRFYACGETDQQLSMMFRGHKKEKRTFPAGVFLFEHESGERILFDTGYATSIYKSGLPGFVYRKLQPPRVTEQDEIRNQLLSDGIEPSTIGRVVLSHAHPDHLGGVQFFPDAQFVMSQGCADTIQKPRWRDLVFRGLLPEWFEEAPKLILDDEDLTSTPNEFVQSYDLLGDESFLLTKLPGHAPGQIGALVLNKLLLAADASWGKDLLVLAPDMRFAARAANYDMGAYRATVSQLQELEAQGVELCFSHDTYDRKVLLP